MGGQHIPLLVPISHNNTEDTSPAFRHDAEMPNDPGLRVGLGPVRMHGNALDPGPVKPSFGDLLDRVPAHDDPQARPMLHICVPIGSTRSFSRIVGAYHAPGNRSAWPRRRRTYAVDGRGALWVEPADAAEARSAGEFLAESRTWVTPASSAPALADQRRLEDR
jgi:hypothetical protein